MRAEDDAGARRAHADDELVRELRGGGKGRADAVSRLFRRYATEFRRYFRRHGLGDAEADDLVQETFVKIVRACDTYQSDGPLEAWLWAIARNGLMSHFRGARPTVALDALEPDGADALLAGVGGSGGDPALLDCVRRAFGEFARHYSEGAEALLRVVLDGWEYEELAVFLARTPGATREFVSQCRKRLREHLEPCLEMVHGG